MARLRSIKGGGKGKPPGPPSGTAEAEIAELRERVADQEKRRLELLSAEARSYSYEIVTGTDRAEMAGSISRMAGAGWEPFAFNAVATRAADEDGPGLTFVCLFRRGGVLVRK